jgi:hypothetical protein
MLATVMYTLKGAYPAFLDFAQGSPGLHED